MIILFQNTFLKEFLACNDYFGLFSKIKKGAGASFWCTFSAWSFCKNVPYFSINGQSFSVTPSFSRYQTKCVIKFSFRQLMTSWILRFFLNQPLKQWPTGRKRGKDRNTKNWIFWEQKELFRWNKKHFS